MSVLWNFFRVNETHKTQAICNLFNGSICKQHDSDIRDRIGELRHYGWSHKLHKMQNIGRSDRRTAQFCAPWTHPKTETRFHNGPEITTCPVTARHTSIGSAGGSCVFTVLADCNRADLHLSTTKSSVNLVNLAASCFNRFFFFALNFSSPPISFSGFFLFSMFANLNLSRSTFF